MRDAISTRQVKAARALLSWSQEELARQSGVSYPTIARLESVDGQVGGRAETGEKIRKTLERAGVEFTNGGQPGVRLRGAGGTIAADQLNASNDE
jgi:predicted transcriptional regulator